MGQKHETQSHERLFFAFVDLEPPTPVVYIVPAAVVAEAVSRSHQAWLALPGRGGRLHKDNPMRRIVPRFAHAVPGFPDGWLDVYRERWDLLTNDQT